MKVSRLLIEHKLPEVCRGRKTSAGPLMLGWCSCSTPRANLCPALKGSWGPGSRNRAKQPAPKGTEYGQGEAEEEALGEVPRWEERQITLGRVELAELPR